jgi:KipI family sensor histidine kinase inhibitor
VTISPASDRSLLVTFAGDISLETHQRVRQLSELLRHVRGVINIHPGYSSVLVEFDPRRRLHGDVEDEIRRLASQEQPETEQAGRLIEIPVRYGGEFGPDLEDVAAHAGLTPERVIELHSGAAYLVYFLGFSPGFPYLGGLPAELATPRLRAPRPSVPAGSVAIGGSQTGIYPTASPGGWRIIGRTPARLFDPDAEPPTLLQMGDRVRFVPVPEDLR